MRKRSRKVKGMIGRIGKNINTNTILESGLTYLAVDQLPDLINSFMKNKPLTGLALDAASTGVAYVAATMLGKDIAANTALGIGIGKFASDNLGNLIPQSSTGTSDYYRLSPSGKRLSDYVNIPSVMSPNVYSSHYLVS